jgi:FAD synthetase
MNHQMYIPNQKLLLSDDKKIVLVGGCFDILHFGHFQFLEKARACGNYLIVALEPDERIVHNKKRNPTHTQLERVHNLLALKHVDHVISLPLLDGFNDYFTLVKMIKPHIIAVTNNDPQMLNKQKQAYAVEAQLAVVTEMIGAFSSSAIYQQLTD